VFICLERGTDLHMAQLMPLPLTVTCFSKILIGFTFLVPAHPGSPERADKRALARVCCLGPKYEHFCACLSCSTYLTMLYSVVSQSLLYLCLQIKLIMIPHLPFFLHFFLTYLFPYLSIPLRIDTLRFQAGCRKRRLNLALVFCVYFVLQYISFDW